MTFLETHAWLPSAHRWDFRWVHRRRGLEEVERA